MRQFGYVRPTTLDDALHEALANHGNDVEFLGGGTNLVDLMKLDVSTPGRLVDVTGLPYDMVTLDVDGVLTIGGTARNSDIAVHEGVRHQFPLISQALLSGASGQLRNVATAGGNLLQRTRCSYFMDVSKPCNKREPGSGCPARAGEHHNLAILGASEHCIATHPSDFAVALAATGARVGVVGPDGTRDIAFEDFYLPVGETPHLETTLAAGEIITSIVVPPLPPNARSAYRKVRERASYAFAVGSVAAAVSLAGHRVDDVRIALGAVASRPWRARTAEEVLRGRPATLDMFRDAADAELGAAQPLPGNAYKVPLVRDLIVSVLSDLSGADGTGHSAGEQVR
jgi:xanthine dehydrogenase YagS FAD-binding subunit